MLYFALITLLIAKNAPCEVYHQTTFEHLYSPRMVEEIKEEKKWNIKQTNSDMA